MDIKREYPTYEAIENHIRRARLERSLVVGDFIAGAVFAAVQGVGAAVSLLQRGMHPGRTRRTLEA
jgi:hypothetical protein